MKGIEGDIQLKIMQMKRLDSIDSVDKFFKENVGNKLNLFNTIDLLWMPLIKCLYNHITAEYRYYTCIKM